MTRDQILAAVAAHQLSPESALAELDALYGSNGQPHALTVRANPDKGTISLYGLGRMPVTLYPNQWRRLFAEGRQAIESFQERFGRYLPSERGQVPEVPAALIGPGLPFRRPADRQVTAAPATPRRRRSAATELDALRPRYTPPDAEAIIAQGRACGLR